MTSLDITIIGAGLDGFEQLTVEAQRAVRSARVVFYSPVNGPLPRDSISPLTVVIDIELNEYQVGAYRPEMYRRMAKAVIEAAQKGPGVVVLQPGSAVVVDAVTSAILDGAISPGLSVQVMPGVSSIEAVMCMLGYDLVHGLQVFLAQNMLLFNQTLRPTVAAIVLQPGYFDTRYWTGAARSHPRRFDRLAAQFRKTHPPEAPMALVVVASLIARRPASLLWFRLADFDAVARVISPLHTLFVPAVQVPSSDEEIEQQIESWPALLTAVERTDDDQPRCEDSRYWFNIVQRELSPEILAQSSALAAQWQARASPQGGVQT